MNVGDIVVEKIDDLDITKKGKVIFVHPQGCFYTVEFYLGNQIVRQCYMFEQRPSPDYKPDKSYKRKWG